MSNRAIINKLVILNTIIVTVVLFILILMIAYTIRSTKKIKRYVSSITDSFLPKLSHQKYENICYPQIKNNLKHYTKNNLIFFISCLMSVYNISSGYEPCFPPGIVFKRKIGPTGYLIKADKWNIFCFRGTIEGKDIFTDIDSVQTNFIDLDGKHHDGLKVHRGFHSIWLETLYDINSCLFKENCIFIGHSLGGTCAHLAAAGVYLKTNIKYPVFIFGSPKVGNKEITNIIDTLSVINENDFISTLPPAVFKVSETPCYYSSYPQKVCFDVQTGNIFDNHSLTTYGYGISREFISDTKVDIIWKT